MMSEKLITKSEALKLYEHETIESMYTVHELMEYYNENRPIKEKGDPLFEQLSLLSFIYLTGRIQGIREERKRHCIRSER